MQNTIIKEFADRKADVTTVIWNEGGKFGENREWLETVWSNLYLRGTVLCDETGEVSQQSYGQPYTGLPFGRGFLIDPEGRVVLPHFGHQPAMVIDRIREVLRRAPVRSLEMPDR